MGFFFFHNCRSFKLVKLSGPHFLLEVLVALVIALQDLGVWWKDEKRKERKNKLFLLISVVNSFAYLFFWVLIFCVFSYSEPVWGMFNNNSNNNKKKNSNKNKKYEKA